MLPSFNLLEDALGSIVYEVETKISHIVNLVELSKSISDFSKSVFFEHLIKLKLYACAIFDKSGKLKSPLSRPMPI